MPTATTETTDHQRVLLTDGLPDDSFPVPSEARFGSEGVIDAPELGLVGSALVAEKSLGLEHLRNYRVGYLWSRTGGTRAGKPNLGSAALCDRKLKHYSELDVVVTIAADHARDEKLTCWQVEALLCHLLNHVTISVTDKTGEERLAVRGHDAELFRSEIRRYGPWSLDLKMAAKTMIDARQLGFQFAENGAAADVADDGERIVARMNSNGDYVPVDFVEADV